MACEWGNLIKKDGVIACYCHYCNTAYSRTCQLCGCEYLNLSSMVTDEECDIPACIPCQSFGHVDRYNRATLSKNIVGYLQATGE